MSIKCLMIETPDKKRLFTNLGSRKQLEECCRAFDAKMYVVRAGLKRSHLMTLPRLVVALCENSCRRERTEFEIIESKKKISRRGRSSRR